MSDSSAGRTHNTVAIKAALIFPGDPVPNMGHDAARIPVRVVWRESDAAADPTVTSGSAGAVRLSDARAMLGDDRGDDDPAPGVTAASGPERAPSPGLSGIDPIAKFLEANDVLDRISGGGKAEMPSTAVPATNGKDGQDPGASVPVVDDNGAPIQGAEGEHDAPSRSSAAVICQRGDAR